MLNKKHWTAVLMVGFCFSCAPAEKPVANTADIRVIKNEPVEASCGECQFDMPGDGCHLAIRLEGQTFWVDGSGIDDHGDAHGADGLCNQIRQARVSGVLENGRFTAGQFELLPESGGDDLQTD